MRRIPIAQRLKSWSLLPALLAFLLGACSSSERSDLILVTADLAEVPSAKSLKVAILDANSASVWKEQVTDVPTLSGTLAKIALSQTAGMTSVVVRVQAFAGEQLLGEGTQGPILITSGQNAGPVLVVIKAGASGPDGGSSDTLPARDSGAPDSSLRPDSGAAEDAGASRPDGARLDGAGSVDTGSARLDSAIGQPDTGTDLGPLPVDAAVDRPPVDTAAPDTSPDTTPGTLLTALNGCKTYVHYPDSPAVCESGSNQEDVIVSTVVFTPDGKYLVTAANNTWVKLWKVVDTGLEDTNVVFVGTGFRVSASISPDGNTLALGNQNGNIFLYDLKAAIESGTVSQTGTLSTSSLTNKPDGYATKTLFTTDGKQLVAMYPSTASWDDALTVVWDLTTRLPIREITRDWQDDPMAVYPAPSTGPLWLASALAVSMSGDGGSYYQTTVTLENLADPAAAKPSFTVPGEVYKIAWSSDAKTLAIGTNEGEVGLWDLTNLSNIQRLGSPLVPATATGSADSVYGLAFSRDDGFLAMGTWIYRGPSTLRLANLKTKAITARQQNYEPRAFGFHPDGQTWAIGLGGCGHVLFCRN
jgi:WD40 repeat protein